MKTIFKNLLTIGVLAMIVSVFSASSARAQGSSVNVTLNVTLVDVLAMTVNDNTTTLTFATADDYKNGLNVSKANQLTITSNKPYDLKVKSGTDLVNASTSASIPVSNVTVQVENASGMGTTPALALSSSDQIIANNAPAAILKSVGMKYSTTAGNTAFLSAGGTYSATLLYSIAAH
ncbi:hypothetical protein [Larkinella terrae]|uniref:DUF4402 domain-containing protein n=1 Tax=Larkinella terrae TaxID=2025311 RepID=A0A7K0EMK5_9BACT|nr:hypothetical protein [Larkinella terrae]MRS62658.1 hypothetical protein [Larkinella terrae]